MPTAAGGPELHPASGPPCTADPPGAVHVLAPVGAAGFCVPGRLHRRRATQAPSARVVRPAALAGERADSEDSGDECG